MLVNSNNLCIITTTIPNDNISEKRINNIINSFSKYNIPIIVNDYQRKEKSINQISCEMIINNIELFKKMNIDYVILCDNDFNPIDNFLEELNITIELLPKNWRCLHLCPGYLHKRGSINETGKLNTGYNMFGIDYNESGRFYVNCDSDLYSKKYFWLGGPVSVLLNKKNLDDFYNDFLHTYNRNDLPNDVIFTRILKNNDYICREPLLGFENDCGRTTFR